MPRALLFWLATAGVLAACQTGGDASQVAAADVASVGVQQTSQPASAVARPAAQARTALDARQLIRSGAVRLRAEDHDAAVAAARALATALGGFVGAEDSHRYPSRVETTLVLRVPAARFDTLLAAVAGLDGELVSKSVAVEDVTRQVADLEARLAVRRAAEAQYLELLARADTIPNVLAVEARLQEVREAIESAEAERRILGEQVALSTLTATLFEDSPAGVTAGPGFFARAGRAVEAGWNGLLAVALALLAVWPVVLLVAVAGAVVVGRRLRRARPAPVPSPRDAEWRPDAPS